MGFESFEGHVHCEQGGVAVVEVDVISRSTEKSRSYIYGVEYIIHVILFYQQNVATTPILLNYRWYALAVASKLR